MKCAVEILMIWFCCLVLMIDTLPPGKDSVTFFYSPPLSDSINWECFFVLQYLHTVFPIPVYRFQGGAGGI